MEDEVVLRDALLDFADLKFFLTRCRAASLDRKTLFARAETLCRERNMSKAYVSLCAELNITPNAEVVNAAESANAAALKEIDEKIADAEENLGESEVREAYNAKAVLMHLTGTKEEAVAAYKALYEKTVALGQRFDILFCLMRIGFAFGDEDLIKTQIERGHKLVDEGGDWERRNKLKVYEALYSAQRRQFAPASKLFLECVATFSSTELMDFKTFVAFVVVTSAIAVERPVLKSKVIDAPEVLQAIGETAHLQTFLNSFYDCTYHEFFTSLVGVCDWMERSFHVHAHVNFYNREMRLRAYAQYLESYKSVTLISMSKSFGVSEDFLDRDLSRMIAAGRLPAKIDKVAGSIETNRPDSKNALYKDSIKHGDQLLNRLQRLSRVIDI
eukprot:ANDGO_02310.mRNA.1 26S proteasome non-ATPase regulatory subunit 6 homolog